MTQTSTIIEKLNYNLWANQQFGAWLNELAPAFYDKAAANSFPSLRATWNHIELAETGWFNKMKEVEGSVFPSFDDLESCAEQVKSLLRQSKVLLDYGSSFSIEEWKITVEYQEDNTTYRPTRRQVFEHVLNHSTYHRGQLISIANQLDLTELPSTDLITYLRNVQ